MLTDEDIVQFQKLYKQEYGRDMSLEEAREEAEKLFQLYMLVYGLKPGERL